jgi:hypothetical protein
MFNMTEDGFKYFETLYGESENEIDNKMKLLPFDRM